MLKRIRARGKSETEDKPQDTETEVKDIVTQLEQDDESQHEQEAVSPSLSEPPPLYHKDSEHPEATHDQEQHVHKEDDVFVAAAVKQDKKKKMPGYMKMHAPQYPRKSSRSCSVSVNATPSAEDSSRKTQYSRRASVTSRPQGSSRKLRWKRSIKSPQSLSEYKESSLSEQLTFIEFLKDASRHNSVPSTVAGESELEPRTAAAVTRKKCDPPDSGHVLSPSPSEADQTLATQHQETVRKNHQLTKQNVELRMTVETLQAEKIGLADTIRMLRENLEGAIENNHQANVHEVEEDLGKIIATISKEKEELQNEVEVHALRAATFREDFEREHRDRVNALLHIKSLTNDLKEVSKEREALRNALKETAMKYEEQVSVMCDKIDRLNKNVTELAAEVQSQTEKKEHYKKMMKSYRDELAFSREQTKQQNMEVSDELAPFKLHFHEPLPISRKVGSGCYGTVYAIEVDGVQCIAKRVQDILLGEGGQEHVDGDQRSAIQQKFREECILLSKIRHPNIVQFMGVQYGRDMYDLTLIMENLPIDLRKCLEKCEADKYFIPLSIRFSILLDITYGLLHLHNRSILHRDLTAGNVLLTSNMQAKIADLGVSRMVKARYLQRLSKLPGTIAYMPPEALQDEPEYNLRLDIFSFGVLALFVALQLFPDFSWEHVPDGVIAKGESELYKRRKWMTKIGEQHYLYPLIVQCLHDKSIARPNTMELNTFMKELSGKFPRRVQDISAMLTQLNKLGMSDICAP